MDKLVELNRSCTTRSYVQIYTLYWGVLYFCTTLCTLYANIQHKLAWILNLYLLQNRDGHEFIITSMYYWPIQGKKVNYIPLSNKTSIVVLRNRLLACHKCVLATVSIAAITFKATSIDLSQTKADTF